MPANATQKLRPRQVLPPVATGYEIAPTTGAAPSDPYSPTAGLKSGGTANELMNALGIATKVTIPAAIAVGEDWAKDQKKKGIEARFNNMALDKSKSNAFIDGYERMDGQFKGIQFDSEVKDYTAKNSHLDPLEFKAGLDELQKKHVGGLIHQGQLDSFLPRALKSAEDSANDYQKIKTEQVLKERNTKVTQISGAMKDSSVNEALKEIGIPGGSDQLADNPLLHSTIIANREAFIAKIGPALRGQLDEMRANYKALRMSTPEISAILLGQVGRQAVALGLPELMSYALIKDASGLSVADAYPDKVDAYMQQALSNRKTFTNEALVRQRQAEKDAVVAYTNNMIFATASIPAGDNVVAATVLTAFQTSPLFSKMDPSDTRRMAEDLFAIVNRKGFPDKSDPDVYSDLRLRAELKTTTPQEINDKRKSLSFAHYSELLNNLTAQTTKAKDEAKDANLDVYRRAVAIMDENLSGVLHPTDKAGIALNPMNARVLARAKDQSMLELDALLKEHGSKRENVPTKDIIEMGKRIIKENMKDVKFVRDGKSIDYYDDKGKPVVDAEKPSAAAKTLPKLPPMQANTASGKIAGILVQNPLK